MFLSRWLSEFGHQQTCSKKRLTWCRWSCAALASLPPPPVPQLYIETGAGELSWLESIGALGILHIFNGICSIYVSPDFWIWYPHRGVVTDAAERRPAVLQCAAVWVTTIKPGNPNPSQTLRVEPKMWANKMFGGGAEIIFTALNWSD